MNFVLQSWIVLFISVSLLLVFAWVSIGLLFSKFSFLVLLSCFIVSSSNSLSSSMKFMIALLILCPRIHLGDSYWQLFYRTGRFWRVKSEHRGIFVSSVLMWTEQSGNGERMCRQPGWKWLEWNEVRLANGTRVVYRMCLLVQA